MLRELPEIQGGPLDPTKPNQNIQSLSAGLRTPIAPLFKTCV